LQPGRSTPRQGLFLAGQVPVVVLDSRAALIYILETGVVPASVDFPACATQFGALHIHVLAGAFVVAWRQATLASARTPSLAFLGTAEVSVVVDDLTAAARAVVD
jgi:hypothetical protein